MSEPPQDVTALLLQWGSGDNAALEKLTPLVYDDLRRLARSYLRSERSEHTLQSTALVHEAYMRLIDQRHVQWQNRAHFFGISAQLIRRILVDHARAAQAEKRGGGAPKLSIEEGLAATGQRDFDLVALDDALRQLAELDPQQARIVELRYFAGLTVEETAEVMQVSTATVKRDWVVAKAWLRREIIRGA
ncbi:MAG: sigma-70 family RNA polymerase sigma factor [Acidobacteriaceae bacterium]|nr:sigma-70 family RNA polymerase sigma factor [Acidobacteriaceae bacterium]